VTSIRQATRDFTAYTLQLQKKRIPADAILQDFRIGLGHEGPLPRDARVASFRYEGQLHFNLSAEVITHTRLVEIRE
jgi:hypothetical protein